MIYTLIHVRGCSRPALLVENMPITGEPLSKASFRDLSGNPIKFSQDTRCGSCNEPLTSNDMECDFVKANEEVWK